MEIASRDARQVQTYGCGVGPHGRIALAITDAAFDGRMIAIRADIDKTAKREGVNVRDADYKQTHNMRLNLIRPRLVAISAIPPSFRQTNGARH